MVFSSLFFIYVFLAANLIIYALCRDISKKNLVMLIFSLIFYAWAGPKYIILLVGMTFIAWISSMMIESSRSRGSRKAFLFMGVGALIFVLFIFKYLTWILTGLQFITGMPEIVPQIVLPIGISFYTFQLVSYVVDVYRQEVAAQRKFHLLLLYASLFHQCIAGPIVRYEHVEHEILNRKPTVSERSMGVKRFAIGLAKKAILANTCAAMVDNLLPADSTALAAVPALGILLGALCYMLQIYLDFSAYSDMAIGMGLMIGFHYRENFMYPYAAVSVTDFWHRWHISLSTFFRDYVYIPLGGSRRGTGRTIFNLFIVWGLTGLWHGASLNFVCWGLYYFVFLVLEKMFFRDFFKSRSIFWSRLYTLAVVFFGWMIFKFDNFGQLGIALKGIFCLNGNKFTGLSTSIIFKNHIFFLIVAIIAVTPLMKILRRKIISFFKRRKAVPYPLYIFDLVVPAVLLFLSTMALIGNSYNPFIYFRF